MLDLHTQTQFTNWFEQHLQDSVVAIQAMPVSGSERCYYRVLGHTRTAVGVFNLDVVENQTFYYCTQHFLQKNILVPRLYATAPTCYLLEDLGDTTLLDKVLHSSNDVKKTLYQQALTQLAQLQIPAKNGFDFNNCISYADFNQEPMLWDLHYFKYCFLLPNQVIYDEYKLEQEFKKVVQYLCTNAAEMDYLMFRDFQARNIMYHQDQLYFIDYQGCKKGALQYDVVSLLYQAKANLSLELRQELLDYYIQTIQQFIKIDEVLFRQQFKGYILLRLLQVLGAYGFRGLWQRKTHFLNSIPFAIQNLEQFIHQPDTSAFLDQWAYLKEVLVQLVEKCQATD